MYLCLRGIDFASFCDFTIGFWNYSDSMVIFVFYSIYIFQLKSDTNNVIKATHTTPVKHYIDDLTFTLTGSGTNCNVQVGSFTPTDNNQSSR